MDTTSESEIAHSIINLSSSSLICSSYQRSDQQPEPQEESLFVQRVQVEEDNNGFNESLVEAEKVSLKKGRPTRKKGRLFKQEEELEELPEPKPIPTVSSSRRGKKIMNQSPPTSPYQSVFPQVVTPSYYQQGMFQAPFTYSQFGTPGNSNQVYQYPQPQYSPYILSPPSSKKKSKSNHASDDEADDEKPITFSQTLPPITIPQVRLPPGTQPIYIVVPVPQPMYHSNYPQQQQHVSQQEQDNSSDSDYQASIIDDDFEERPTKRQSEKKRKIDEEEKLEEMKRKRIEIDDNNDSLFDKLIPGEGILYRRRRKLNTKHKAEESNSNDRMYSLFPKITNCCGKTKSLAYNGSQAGKGYHYILKYKPSQAESDRLNQLIKENADLSLFIESSDSTKSPFTCYSTLGKRTDNSPPVIAFRGVSQYLECCFRVEKEGEKRHGISDSSSYTLSIKSGDEKIVFSQPFKLISKEKPEEPCSKLAACIRNRPKTE